MLLIAARENNIPANHSGISRARLEVKFGADNGRERRAGQRRDPNRNRKDANCSASNNEIARSNAGHCLPTNILTHRKMNNKNKRKNTDTQKRVMNSICFVSFASATRSLTKVLYFHRRRDAMRSKIVPKQWTFLRLVKASEIMENLLTLFGALASIVSQAAMHSTGQQEAQHHSLGETSS